MHFLIDYFSHAPDWHRVLILTSSIFLFWNIENFFGVTRNYPKWKHALLNTFFALPAIPVQLLLGIILLKTIDFDTKNHFGLMFWLPLIKNQFYIFLITFIVLDFCEYTYHILMHHVKTLWKFHLVHHSDRVVDVSTTLREHPGETFIRLSFLVVWVFLSGASFWALIFRQFIQIISNVFAHANFRLSAKADKIIGWVFITPNLHHVHHHYQQPYTDSNYGDVLSIWDRIFGTYRELDVHETIFGVDTHMASEENADIKNLILMPLAEYRRQKNAVYPQPKSQGTTFSKLLFQHLFNVKK
ncbi:sterol desaturase family protein [Emticicia sp. TH156]|uniref:sterol desaturase family protein n=1 Tax=Emticicia sp. TH156 TaxID=2067454 RepID=UPI0013047713|nr:sterol desaturase family protein [Emticicia sp. TH156]